MHTLLLNADAAPKTMIPLSRLTWQEAIRKVISGDASVMHEYEDWVVRSPSVTMRVPSVVMLRRYVRPGYGVRAVRANIFLRDRHTCQYCHVKFPDKELTLDHVLPKSFGGKTVWENLVAACGKCNLTRGNDIRIRPLVEPWKPTYHQLVALKRGEAIEVPHESWIDYIGWDNVTVQTRNRPRLFCAAE